MILPYSPLPAADDNLEIRKYALSVLPQVARTGSHILHFVMFMKEFRGWSYGLRKAISSWFIDMPERKLAYQMVKYQQRDNYSMRDLLRLAHPKAPTPIYNNLFLWATKGWGYVEDQPSTSDETLQFIWAFERAKRTESAQETATLINKYKLPREAIPTQHLTSTDVWKALLQDMPMEALLRNLATMTRIGLIKPLGEETKNIANRLRNGEAIRKEPRLVRAAVLFF